MFTLAIAMLTTFAAQAQFARMDAWGTSVAADDFNTPMFRWNSIAVTNYSNKQHTGFYLASNSYDRHWIFNNAYSGIEMGDWHSLNLSPNPNPTDVNAYNPVEVSGYHGLALHTANGFLALGENGIMSIGLGNEYTNSPRYTNNLRALMMLPTNNPFKLYVAGGIKTEAITVSLVNNWPDYVFKKGYDLLPLSKVEEHIQQKGFLPNTPSAEVVEKEGLSLAETAKNQQEKIEEIFLHLIDMEKRVKALEAENAALKLALSHR
jgi:hypothetical protein